MPPTPPKHRITRMAARTLAACTLFLVWYIGSWLGYSWLIGRGTLRSAACEPVGNVVFGPIHGYLISGFPGAQDLENLRDQLEIEGAASRYR